MNPVLLLIPGLLNDARVWEPVRQRLAAEAEVRIADNTPADSIAGMARNAWTLLAGIAPGRGLVVAGFSLGGYVALQMLAEPARRIDALALVSTSARPESAEAAANRQKTIAAMERDFAKVVESLLVLGTHAPWRQDTAALDNARRIMSDVGAETGIRHNRAILVRADRRETLRGYDGPSLVVVGDDDRITPPALSEEAAALAQRATLKKLPACGHFSPLERPDDVAAALRALIEETR